MYDRLRWEEKTLLEEAQKMGVPTRLVDAKTAVYDSLTNTFSVPFGQTVYLRCISHFRAQSLAATIEGTGANCINTYRVLEACSNKLLCTLALRRRGVPTPRTMLAFSPEGVERAASFLGYPMVIKPLVGSWGRLISLVKDRDALNSIVELREELANPLDHIYYLQEYVKRPPRDIRAIVVGDEVVSTVYRESAEGEWRTNVARGATTRAFEPPSELLETIIKASEAVGGGILGVDAMESPEGYVVHEVNGTVEFRGAQSATTANIAQKIIGFLAKEAKN